MTRVAVTVGTEMKMIKHPFRQGVNAQKRIAFSDEVYERCRA
jgi:ATP:corrinoid adenosyltransferase